MRSLILLVATLCALAMGLPAQAQEYDGNAPVSSAAEKDLPKSPSGVSAGSSGAVDAAPGDALATFKAKPESAEDVWRLWSLEPLRASEGIERIIGPDDRVRVSVTTTYPERAVVLITRASGRCSGSMISPNTVVTAGHCVHDGGSSGAWSTNVRVYPGRNGSQSPYGSCAAKTLYSVVGWVRDKSEQYDYGAIKLDCSIGNTTGWFGLFWQTASLVGTPAQINGYPGDKPLEQWKATDSVRGNDALQVFYQNDTVPGSSGSGVFTTASSVCSGPCIMAVHAYGTHGSGSHAVNNHGVRISKPVFDNLVAWRNAS